MNKSLISLRKPPYSTPLHEEAHKYKGLPVTGTSLYSRFYQFYTARASLAWRTLIQDCASWYVDDQAAYVLILTICITWSALHNVHNINGPLKVSII